MLHSPHQALFALSFSLNGSRWLPGIRAGKFGLEEGVGDCESGLGKDRLALVALAA